MIRRGASARRGGAQPESPFWISYADLMTSLTIMLLLVVSAFLLKVQQEKEGLDRQVKIKRQIIDQLLTKLGRKYPVSIDPRTGAVTIQDQILFAFNESKLTPKGQDFLRRFIPEYSAILLHDPETRSQISRIVVEGHADRMGAYAVNMRLSMERAFSVTAFLFEGIPTFQEREFLRQVLSANGRSFMDQKRTDELSRRVELQFQMKDWDLVKAGSLRSLLHLGR